MKKRIHRTEKKNTQHHRWLRGGRPAARGGLRLAQAGGNPHTHSPGAARPLAAKAPRGPPAEPPLRRRIVGKLSGSERKKYEKNCIFRIICIFALK